jgi:Leucine-rich repeat (LRR) protein
MWSLNFLGEADLDQICELLSLEILDLGHNKLRILPPELSKLTSLKVLSVQKNRIEDLPLCLADMLSLQVLKLDGNPIRFPPKEILQPQASSPPNGGFLNESEVNDVAITAQIKKFLKQKAISYRSETESGGEESSEGAETPRPLKRVMSGRFPIKVNGTDVPDLRSPALPRAPPIPSRSHYRGLSQQNAALRRPGVMPLTMGNSNERLRSNSESLLQASRERSDKLDRSRRMGIVSKRPSELGTVEEMKFNRYSHFRGLSHGSAIQNSSVNDTHTSRPPASPADTTIPRATYVRRLSSLPERKRESSSPDPIIEGAKGILFALFQVHPMIQNLIGLTRDGSNKRNSLERVFYNASTQVEELDRDLQTYDTYSEEDEEMSPRSNDNVHSACLTCVSAYIHVCSLLSRNVETLISNGDPRYIRTLLLLVYGSLAEVRNAGASLFAPAPSEMSKLQPVIEDTLRPQLKEKVLMSVRERPIQGPRSRSATVVQHSNPLRVATDVRPHNLNGAGRSATMTSATPRSGESFGSSVTSGGRSIVNGDYNDELFEKIFLGLQQSSEMAIRTLPAVSGHFVTAMKYSIQQGNADQLKQYWQMLCQKCSTALQTAEGLKARLSIIKLKEPSIRAQSTFWELCSAFINVS